MIHHILEWNSLSCGSTSWRETSLSLHIFSRIYNLRSSTQEEQVLIIRHLILTNNPRKQERTGNLGKIRPRTPKHHLHPRDTISKSTKFAFSLRIRIHKFLFFGFLYFLFGWYFLLGQRIYQCQKSKAPLQSSSYSLESYSVSESLSLMTILGLLVGQDA